MIDFDFEEYCCGCRACENICPVNAIKMEINDEGFIFPKININICINCRKCENICPHLNARNFKVDDSNTKGTWLYSSDDREAKLRSSSGAAFYEIARKCIENNGFICGCVWNEDLEAEHIVSNTEDDLCRMQGSKYVQSNMNECYSQIISCLKDNKTVIFSGTPCQAIAVNNIVLEIENGRYRENLITVALICHGVASPLIWKSYKKWISEEQGSPLTKVNFRDKAKEGYKKSYCKYEFKNGTIIYQPTYLHPSKYIEATLVYNLAIRNSCTHCECKGVNAGIDIIIGDWYAENQGEGKLGTSCIVAHTRKGKTFLEDNLDNLRKFSYEEVVKKNNMIVKSIGKAKNRSKFFDNICDYHYWSKVEKLFPPKYKYKKLLITIGMYDFLKKLLDKLSGIDT